ncbi:MAG: N-acetylmuramoyl-L-alanine amidase [Bacteroidota bacterium]|nr:N-acetylmuramoyl-L-alanine amidase [Bacteroidota bacterium]
MKIKNHILEDTVFKKSPNHSGNNIIKEIDTIVIHYTAGSSAESSINVLCNPNTKASAHVVVAQDGAITQLVPFNIKAWHAGKSHHHNRVGMNSYSIGIEIDNPGRLTKAGNKYISWFGREYPENRTIEAKHANEDFLSFWHTYSEEQINSVFELCEVLSKQYNIKYIVGHDEISPGRKSDPGPAFPIEKIRSQILYPDRNEDAEEELPDNGEVAVALLNFREKPSGNGEKITAPLKKGTKVKIENCNGDWYYVSVSIKGWVMSKYLKTK